jgi:glycosyltransferase involved in cell wall biosynthesis
MFVTILTSSYPRSSEDEAGIFVARLVDALNAQGVHGEVIVPRDINESAHEQFGHFELKRFDYGLMTRGKLAFGSGMMPNIRRNPFVILQAPNLIFQMMRLALKHTTSADLIHANWTLPLLAAWLLHRFRRIPYIVTIRGEDFKLLQQPICRALLLPALRSASKIVSVNSSFIDYLSTKAKIPRERFEEIPNGVHMQQASPEEIEKFKMRFSLNTARYLTFIGTLIPRKRIELIFDALTGTDNQVLHLLLCGRLTDVSYLHDLRSLAQRLGIEHRIHFLGPLPPQDIPALLALTEFYVTASAFEGRPNAVLEALACGKAVLASNIPAHAEIILHKSNGFLFANAKELAQQLNALNDNVVVLQEITEKAKASVSALTWESCAKRYIQVYEEVKAQQHGM